MSVKCSWRDMRKANGALFNCSHRSIENLYKCNAICTYCPKLVNRDCVKVNTGNRAYSSTEMP